ncbi:hypothetical protein A2U01_0024677 [Trifolium medium]|uniref:Uncharacterized protein n=1 Tax=Trifolium medium TaxID=97028 RepID=A0A392NUZ1_9FABA|nr:hypothetical protein [Trifolium medium]
MEEIDGGYFEFDGGGGIRWLRENERVEKTKERVDGG